VEVALMKNFILAALFAAIGSGGHASTKQYVDLSLRVDAVGITSVELLEFDEGTTLSFREIPFLDSEDAEQYGISFPRFGSVGEKISFSAIFPPSPCGQLEYCRLDGGSCAGSFGNLSSNMVSVYEGFGEVFGYDFGFSSGLKRGDAGRLDLFAGGRFYKIVLSSNNLDMYVSWDTFQYRYTVAENRLAAVPLPASAFLLAGGVVLSWLAMIQITHPRRLLKSIS